MNRRRTAVGLVLLPLLPFVCAAQPVPARIAFLSTNTEQKNAGVASYFRSELLSVGLVDGKDYVLDFFWADGHYERFPALAQAAVARKPAVIIVTTIASARAAQQVTSTIPIVMTGVNDPVGTGLVASLARPGGNVTGVATMADDIVGKLIELTREIVPGARRIAVLINPQNASNRPIFQTLQKLARAAGMTAEAVEISSPEQIEAALSELAGRRPDVLITGFDSSHVENRTRFAQFASSQGIAIVSADGVYEQSGAVITFTAFRSLYAMSALYVKKILDGAKPADLPVQQPTRFQLVVNTGVAQALKLNVPHALLLRADKVIE